MPDIFDTEDTARERRFADDSSTAVTPVTQNIVEQNQPPIKQSQEEYSPTPSRSGQKRDKHTMHIFTSFCENPEAVTFQTQEDGEVILLLIRRSFITNIPWIFFGIVLMLIPPLLFPFIPFANTPFAHVSGSYIFVLFVFYYLVVISYMFVNFITWYFNTSLITDKRILDIDFQDLVYKNIAETKMDLVQDVSETETGVLRNIFNFGDVLIQTAGTLENFRLEAAPHPDRAVEIVEELIGKARDANV